MFLAFQLLWLADIPAQALGLSAAPLHFFQVLLVQNEDSI